jgi:hypothetical protein
MPLSLQGLIHFMPTPARLGTTRNIGPHELLPIGTPVMVWSERGIISSASLVPESTGKGMISQHVVTLTHRLEKTGRVAGNLIKTWRAIKKPKSRAVNYSAIRIPESFSR